MRIEMEEALQMTKEFHMDRYRLLEALTNGGSKLK
jgi:hypothetical protein